MTFVYPSRKMSLKYIILFSLIFLLTTILILFLDVKTNENFSVQNKELIVYVEESKSLLYENDFLKKNNYSYISKNNATINLDYYINQKVLIKNLQDRFLSSDERYTNFLKSLPDIFSYQDKSQNNFSLFIINNIDNSSSFLKESRNFFENPNSFKSEKVVSNSFLVPTIFTLVAIIFFWFFIRPKKLELIFFLIMFILARFSLNLVIIWSTLILMIFLSFIYSELSENIDYYIKARIFKTSESLKKSIFLKLFLILFFVFVTGFIMGESFSFFVYNLLFILLFVIFYIIKLFFDIYKNYDTSAIFFPLQRLKTDLRKNFSTKKDWPIFLLFLFPLFFMFQVTVEMNFPVPVALNGVDDYSSLVEYSKKKQGNDLDFSDFLLEKIFQKYYKYEIINELPKVGSKIETIEYEVVDGKIKEKKIIINEFTHQWYKSIIKQLKEEDLAKIFFADDKPAKLSRETIQKSSSNRFVLSIILSVLTTILFLMQYNLKDFKRIFYYDKN